MEESYEYHSDGMLATKNWLKGSEAIQIKYDDYFRGIAERVTYPEGLMIRRKINFEGTVAWEEDGRGNRTSFLYDGLNRLVQVLPPLGADTYISWPSPLEQVITRGNYEKRILHNHSGDITRITKKDLSTNVETAKETLYDALGRMYFESYESASDYNLSSGIYFSYDALGRLKSSREFETGQYEHTTSYCYQGPCLDTEGNPSIPDSYGYIKTDPEGYRTAYGYRVFGDPNEKHLMAILREQERNDYTGIYYSRNLYGDLLTSLSFDTVRWQDYYEGKRLVKTSYDPEIGQIGYSYDEKGNVVEKQLPSGLIEYKYDDLDRLTLKAFSDGSPTVEFEYDHNGNVERASRGNTVWTFQYDLNDQNTFSRLAVGNTSYEFSYAYNELDHLASMFYPDGEEVRFSPDALGRASEIGSYATGVTYFGDGTPSEFLYGNGKTYALQKDSRNLPHKLDVGSDVDITYSFNSRRMPIQRSGDQLQDYSYDGILQLTTLSGDNSRSYTYDGLGNMVFSSGLGAFNLDNEKNRLSEVIKTSSANDVTYDLYGNIQTYGSKQFEFGLDGLLKSTDGYQYNYDAFGRRVSIQSSTENKHFVYTDDKMLLVVNDLDTGDTDNYHYLAGHLIAKKSSSPIPPELQIISPFDGSEIDLGSATLLSARLLGIEQPTSEISWSSNLSGSLGTGSGVSVNLSQGLHTITARYQDQNGNDLIDTSSVNVVNNYPQNVPLSLVGVGRPQPYLRVSVLNWPAQPYDGLFYLNGVASSITIAPGQTSKALYSIFYNDIRMKLCFASAAYCTNEIVVKAGQFWP